MTKKWFFLLLVQTECLIREMTSERGIATATVYCAAHIPDDKLPDDDRSSETLLTAAHQYVRWQYGQGPKPDWL